MAAKKRKYHEDTEKKIQAVKKRHDKKETIKQCKKQKYLENPTPKITYQKAKYQENPEVQLV